MTKKAIKSTLKSLPKGSTALNKAYDEAIERIEGQLPDESKLAKSVLNWVIYAKRQLIIKEITHALAIEEGDLELDEDNIPDIEDLISVCASLIAVDEESDVIRLVHYTTQDYFKRVQETWRLKAQEEITSACLTYLSFCTFDTSRCLNCKGFRPT
jgi:predicted ATP-grasp superfamily ATP-dependent carboligase